MKTARPDPSTSGPAALLGIGRVQHARARPACNAFRYRTFFLMLPLRQMRAQACRSLPRNRAGWLSFHDADHGDGGPDALAWVDELLAREGIHDADGEMWLQTFPRVLGYVFKPVSFWFAHRADGSLAAIVAEVNNTFGERHCYLLSGPALAFGREQRVRKAFHVSPFCCVAGDYRFRFMRTPKRCVARVEHHDALGCVLVTSISGELQTLSRAAAWRALLTMPFMTLGVVAGIHWQALRLWLKRVPFHAKPDAPSAPLTR